MTMRQTTISGEPERHEYVFRCDLTVAAGASSFSFATPSSNKDVGDPPESCAAKWSTSARASQHCGHDALVTAEFYQ